MYCRVAATFRNLFKTLVLVKSATLKALRLFYFMTREEKCKLAIEKGYTYNSENGYIYGVFDKKIKRKVNGYIEFIIYDNKKQYKMKGHQFAWYYVNKECVELLDHINGIKDDNRICNLRSSTNQLNQFNQINAKGYSWNKWHKKWQSRIIINGKTKHIGYYKNEYEAHTAYLNAKEIYHKI